MRALHAYAPNDPSRLVVTTAALPSLVPGDVLVRVHASGVTPTELAWPTTWLEPDGTPRSLPIIPGHEVSGVVEATTPGVDGLRVGDEVCGLIDFQRDGADADYVAARATELVRKPRSVDHIQAAAVPLSALTAWQALFDHAHLEPGQTVLIHGAAGGVGLFAVQMAHWKGARVIGTASPGNAARLRELGVDEVIDYRTTRFEDVVHDVDVVFDTVGGDTWERSWQVVRPGGIVVSIAVPRPPVGDGHGIWFVVEQSREELNEIARLIDSGAVEPIVSQVLALDEAPAAYGHQARGQAPGKIVLDLFRGAAPS